jgi:indole-3-glycerol phosphate synthase
MQTTSGEKTILQRIVDARRASIAHRKRVLPEVALKIAVERKTPPARDFAAALSRDACNIIAELKKASPSQGAIRAQYAPAVLAAELETAGAVALSVLTEEDFFSGSLGDLKEARRVVQIPVLRKDFIVDPWQVWEARAATADSFLLIAAVLEDSMMHELVNLGRALGMEPLIEIHSAAELDRVLAAEARVIGVNNRDLHDFSVRLETSLELIERIPDGCVAVCESGLRNGGDLARLRRAGFDAFLIGEHLMKSSQPGEALRRLLEVESAGHSAL